MNYLTIFIVTLLISFASCKCMTNKKSIVWNVGNFSTPESVYYDKGLNTLFVSNIAGEGGQKDGKGWISKLDTDGKIISSQWVTGLNSPAGMRVSNGTLWIADIDEVVAVDMKSGKVNSRIKIDGAKFLNDVAAAPDGTIYVSDTKTGTIHQIKNGKPSVYMKGEELESPNGILFNDGKLYVAAWGKGLADDWSTTTPGRLYYIDTKTKKIHYITKKPLGNLDGLEIDQDGNFIVSDWMAGKIYKVDKSGKYKLIYSGPKGFADIAFVPGPNLIVIPEMLENRITALSTPDTRR